MSQKRKTVTVKGWVAKNLNEIDIENMSFYKTKAKAEKMWGTRQEILPATVTIITQEK